MFFVYAAACSYSTEIYSLAARKNKGTRNERQVLNINDVKIQDLPLLKFEDLAAATNNFDACNKLGQGGFGPVFKVMIRNKRIVHFKS